MIRNLTAAILQQGLVTNTVN